MNSLTPQRFCKHSSVHSSYSNSRHSHKNTLRWSENTDDRQGGMYISCKTELSICREMTAFKRVINRKGKSLSGRCFLGVSVVKVFFVMYAQNVFIRSFENIVKNFSNIIHTNIPVLYYW